MPFNGGMRRRQFAIALVAATWLRAAGGAAAEPAGAATAFVQQVGRDMPGVLGDATSDADKRRRLEPFLARVVDVAAVARFCLGRYWRLATPAQQQEYRQLFLKVLTNEVAGRVGVYGTGTSKVTVLSEITKPDGVYVPTIVQTGGEPPVHVTWVVDASAAPPRILDVQAEGISLRVWQRSDYVAYLNKNDGNLDLFLRTLRARTP
jgi:phospholipid transport system substrate-binding protein